jgi:hypothetical protein
LGSAHDRIGAAEKNRTVNTEFIESLGDLDLGVKVEVGVGELLAFTECAFCVNGLLAKFFANWLQWLSNRARIRVCRRVGR